MMNDDNDHKKKKKILFEEFDRRSLEILSLSSDTAKTYLEKFVPVRWWGRTYNALAYLPSFKMTTKIKRQGIMDDIKSHSNVYDALYVGNDKNTLNDTLSVLYINPHLIFSHIHSGQCTLDIMFRSPLGFESVVMSPKYKFRSFDNKSVEFFIFSDPKLKSMTHPTLGMFCEKERPLRKKFLLDIYSQFMDRIHDFFSRTLYLPYLVHPYRLFLLEEEEAIGEGRLKLISCNLMQYVYHPYMMSRKIVDVHFSYPYNQTVYSSSQEMLTQNSVQLVLDFLHSAFVTTLWINHPVTDNLSRNYNVFWDDDQRINTKKENSKSNSNDLFWIIKPPPDHQNSNKCRNPSGYCHAYINNNNNNNNNNSDLIHQYGCTHLLSLAPSILTSSINEASEKGDTKIFTDRVLEEILLLKDFISGIIKNNNGDDVTPNYTYPAIR